MVKWLVLLAMFTGCTPNPMGVRCDESPSCMKDNEKKHRAAQDAMKQECSKAGMAWIDQEARDARAFPASLGCDATKHACSGSHGCASGHCVSEDESRFCVSDGTNWEGFCVSCADRALMDREQAAMAADLRGERVADFKRTADEEIKEARCIGSSVMHHEAVLADLEREDASAWHAASSGHTVATSAGVTFVVELPDVKKRYELVTSSRYPVTLKGPSGSVAKVVKHTDEDNITRGSVSTADGTTQTWSAVGQGCVSWSLRMSR